MARKPTKQKENDKIKSEKQTSSDVTRPAWPPLKPLIPSVDLSLQTLVEDQIILIPKLWTSSLCKSYVSFLSALPLQTTPDQPKKGNAVRVNDRYQIEDPGFAEHLWSSTALKQLVTEGDDTYTQEEKERLWGGKVVGLNPNIRIYRYRKGQFFAPHYDDSNTVSLHDGSSSRRAKTTWTLLIYLTSPADGCQGGETVFHPDPAAHSAAKGSHPSGQIIVGLETGMALLHKHGADCMLHEGRAVTQGEKWVLRSDLCVTR